MRKYTKTTIHTHASGEAGICANAYLVETDHGVVAVDATLTVSECKSLRAKIDALNKPLLAVLITHPHPDHVAGITQLVQSPDLPIVALESVDKLMRTLEEPKRAQWKPVFKDEWIDKWTYPNRFVKNCETVTFDEVTYRVYDMGPGGDCDANSIWVIDTEPRAAFIGDLVFNGTHAYMADGRISAWLANLDRARTLLADVPTIYPGHGAQGTLKLLNAQKDYLLAYRAALSELSNGMATLSDDAKQELTTRMQNFLPGAPLSFLIAHSADAVASENSVG